MPIAHVQGMKAGIGLRPLHLHELIRTQPTTAWLELHICNYLNHGVNRALLDKISAQSYNLSFHSVNMNLGGTVALDDDYFKKLKQACDSYQPLLVSDHLCFSATSVEHYHDLLPIPLNNHSLERLVNRMDDAQTRLQRPILIENISQYFWHKNSSYSEAEFLNLLCQRSGCSLLLDLNNLYVNQQNGGPNCSEYLDQIEHRNVKEIHLGGHTQTEERLIDSHAEDICDDVWSIYHKYCSVNPDPPCLIEWDSQLPELNYLIELAQKADQIKHDANAAVDTLNTSPELTSKHTV
ncbi:MAG: hypothetical protein ACI93R_001881 [Flavobacteriales bacterium]|jgi:uncharacterized protein (UPF0276 family)